MSNRAEKRKQIAADTMAILEAGGYKAPSGRTVSLKEAVAHAKQGTAIITPPESDGMLENGLPAGEQGRGEIKVDGLTTLASLFRIGTRPGASALCLNFASARNAGGGFLGGAQAQEESLARSSGLYPCLLQADEYYWTNRKTKSCFYTDYMIYSPAVPFFKDDAGALLEEPVNCAVITMPAVNTGVVKQKEPQRLGEVEAVMRRRIQKVLTVAAGRGHRELILGAWGCGVFQNDPKDIARYFRDTLESGYRYLFDEIVFSVYANNDRFITAFQDAFS